MLESLARSQTAAHREVVRAKALLMAADGVADTAIAGSLSVSPASVKSWRDRFVEDGLTNMGQVRKGRGRKGDGSFPDDQGVPQEGSWVKASTAGYPAMSRVSPW